MTIKKRGSHEHLHLVQSEFHIASCKRLQLLQAYIFPIIPSWVPCMNLMIVRTSSPSGTCCSICFTASKTEVCPWNTRRYALAICPCTFSLTLWFSRVSLLTPPYCTGLPQATMYGGTSLLIRQPLDIIADVPMRTLGFMMTLDDRITRLLISQSPAIFTPYPNTQASVIFVSCDMCTHSMRKLRLPITVCPLLNVARLITTFSRMVLSSPIISDVSSPL